MPKNNTRNKRRPNSTTRMANRNKTLSMRPEINAIRRNKMANRNARMMKNMPPPKATRRNRRRGSRKTRKNGGNRR